LDDKKYCPICGIKNNEFDYLNQKSILINDLHETDYYEIETKKEISFLKYKIPKNKVDVKVKKCLQCGSKNALDSRFCVECGYHFTDFEDKSKDDGEHICPKCGTVALEGDLFCSECGTKLE